MRVYTATFLFVSLIVLFGSCSTFHFWVSQNSVPNQTKLKEKTYSFVDKIKRSGIDTILVFNDYYMTSGPLELINRSYIIYNKDGVGFIKHLNFIEKGRRYRLKTSAVTEFNSSKAIYNYFFINRLDTIESVPQQILYSDHNNYYTVDFMWSNNGDEYAINSFQVEYDSTHVKVLFAKFISQSIMNAGQ